MTVATVRIGKRRAILVRPEAHVGRGAMNNKPIVFVVLAGFLGGIVLAAVGLIAGTAYGGNYATDFRFNGLRGYEATGQIGAILGFVSGGALGSFLAGRRTRRST
jgi:hypothetical protein